MARKRQKALMGETSFGSILKLLIIKGGARLE
jgi:hypothetical protein